MNRYALGLCLLTALCSFSVRADNPGTGAYDAPDDKAKADQCRPCYELPQGCKGKLKASCIAYDKAHPGFFSGVDSQCGLPAGTAMSFANTESSCNPNVKNSIGFTGMFQFNTKSCALGNLFDLNVQTQCFCDYTANTRRDYAAQTGGKTPSVGMYYLFHQQGGCGLKLALGGSRSAVDVLTACRRDHNASIAYKSIAGNLPAELAGMNPATITAQQFANAWMNKVGGNAASATTGTTPAGDMCAANGTTPAGDGATVPTDPATGNVTPAFTGLMNLGGGTLSQSLINYLMAASISQLMPDIPETNDDHETKATQETVTVTTNPDGTVTASVVTTTDDTSKTNTYTVNHGQQLWKCNGTYQVVGSAQESTMTAKGCSKVAESAPVSVSATTP
jgi:hypothetical protein